MGNYLSQLDRNLLAKAAVADLGIQWVGCAAALLFKTEKFYDLTGSSTFLYMTWVTLTWAKRGSKLPIFPRQIIQNACVSIWAIRLGTYLFSRILHDGEDRRFRKAKESPMLFWTFWTIQALWVWTTLLPTMMLNIKKYDKPLGMRDYVGWGMFAAGFLIEMVADNQKSRFRADPANRGKFIDSGLWGLCRHPNYLGEILLWSGLFLPASSVLQGKELLSIVSPLFVTFLLTNVSGIPILEQYADRKWGNLVEYQAYKAKTAKLIPFIW